VICGLRTKAVQQVCRAVFAYQPMDMKQQIMPVMTGMAFMREAGGGG
jgi:hypothetical protein